MAARILIKQGDITTYDGHAVVNAANNWLKLGAGVAGAIRRAGGPSIQEECDRHGPIHVGEAAITGAGAMRARWVIHAAAMGDEAVSERSIRESTRASLRLASEHGAKRVAFPILGSGVGGFEFRRAAEVMLEAVRDAPESASLDEIVLYGYSPGDADVLRKLIGQ